MLNKTDEPNTLPLLVVFLRFYARMTQAELGEAAGVEQGLISKYEAGHQPPPEESLKRMARAVGIPWPLVTYLRRVYSALIRLARMRELIEKGLILDSLEELLDRMLVALAPYMIEVVAGLISEEEDPEERRLEADTVWLNLRSFSKSRRRRLLELSVDTTKNWALAERLCDASLESVSSDPEEALGLADLALWIAEKMEGEKPWRSRVAGYCWAHVAHARRAVKDTVGAEAAVAEARKLWEQGRFSDDGLLSESRMRELLAEEGPPEAGGHVP
ncbi:MAG TPA: helix-turn-helix domain-containing protein [Thermoanaerobaculia bacterium]